MAAQIFTPDGQLTQNSDETLFSSQQAWNKLFQEFVVRTCISGSESENKSAFSTDLTLAAKGVTLNVLLDRLRGAIEASHQNSISEPPVNIGLLDETHFSILCSSLREYLLQFLPSSEISSIDSLIQTQLHTILKSLLKLNDKAVGYFIEGIESARNLACRAALRWRFPKYHQDGYFALEQPPIIYLSEDFAAIGERLAIGLGLPRNCIRFIRVYDTTQSIDLPSLETAIEQDKQDGFLPFFVFAVVDHSRVDPIEKLSQLCTQNNMWLHVEGSALSLLLSNHVPPSVTAATTANSFVAVPSQWFYIAHNIAYACFQEPVTSSLVQYSTCPLTALPLWATILKLGKDRIHASFNKIAEMVALLSTKLSTSQSIVISSKTTSSVTFRYSHRLSDSEYENITMLNNLNEQILLDVFDAGVQPLGLTLINENGYNCMRFLPTGYEAMQMTEQTLEAFLRVLILEVNLIDSTLNCRTAFAAAVDKRNKEGLHNVRTANFVGLGAVQFIPPYLAQMSTSGIQVEVREECDSINKQLAAKLRERDSLFSEGRTLDGAACICLGVDTNPITSESAENYVVTIYHLAKEIKFSDKIVSKIAEVIQNGIKLAEQELSKEEEEALYQAGLLRQLPLFGSVVNWLAPIEKPQITGRTFVLTQRSLGRSPSKQSIQVQPTTPSKLRSSSNDNTPQSSPQVERNSVSSKSDSVSSV